LAAVALAAIAPAQAVSLLADSLDRGTSEARGYFRRALGAAAGDTRARSALESLFALESFDERPIAVRVELLRALGPRLGEVAGSAGAFAQTSSDRSFRTRFLLLGPAGELAKRGDARAASFLRDRMLHDQSHHVRAGAASAAAGIAALSPELARALDDSRPRVREAALESLARIDGDAATVQRISVLLASDPWTFVRLAAAQALAGQTSSPQRDAALTEALDDSSTAVRRQVIVALAKSTSQASGERVHALADDPQEPSEIRTTAIWALGQLCRRDSVAVLYKLALRAGVPELPYDRPLGMAALQALGAIHPADLAVRLLPLVRDKRVPQQVRSIAREVIASPRRCPN
jgi:HEAT repeat protein